MTTDTMQRPGTAEREGVLWGSSPREWAETEAQERPAYLEALRHVSLQPGDSVLDVGCGAGTFLRIAADRGAQVHGLDASDGLLEVARERVPEADLRVGDMQWLPFEDGSFDLVTGFCSFFFAADMTAALAEARRVAKPGAPVVVQVWGDPARCDLFEALAAIAPLRGRADGSGPALWRESVLEGIAADAGLRPRESFVHRYAFEYPYREAMLRGLLAAGGFAEAVASAGEERVAGAVARALAGFRRPNGSFRLENEWRFLVATA